VSGTRIVPGAVPNRRDALAEARRLGCTVSYGNGGEYRVVAPDGSRVNGNNRRKDASRALIGLLLRLSRA
jgi:hypothetical protein